MAWSRNLLKYFYIFKSSIKISLITTILIYSFTSNIVEAMQAILRNTSKSCLHNIHKTQFRHYDTRQNEGIPTISKPVKQTIGNAMFPATSMPDNDWWHTLWPNPKNVILGLGIKKGAIAIDLCCGDGYFTFPLAEESSKVYGIELDGGLLEQAKKDGETLQVANCIWMQGDAMKVAEMVTEPVDFILIANTFHGIPDKETLGKNIFSVLKPKGKLAIINWHKKPREETMVLGLPRGPKTEMRMPPTEVENVLSPLGFVFKSLIELPPYHYGAIFAKL